MRLSPLKKIVPPCLSHVHLCNNYSSLSKHAQSVANSNPDLRQVLDEFGIPGKFYKYLIPSKRQLKRDAKLSAPPKPRYSIATELRRDNPSAAARPSKRKSYRISRAIHEVLYDPEYGIASTGTSAASPSPSSWRVGDLDVSTTGEITISWVPVDDVHASLLLDNEYHVQELHGIYTSIRSKLQARLKVKRSQLPKINFIRQDTSLRVLLDIVAEECDHDMTNTDTESSDTVSVTTCIN